MVGKGLVNSIVADQSVKVGLATVLLWPEDAPKPLGLLLPGAKGARHLNRHVSLGKIDGEVRHFRDY